MIGVFRCPERTVPIKFRGGETAARARCERHRWHRGVHWIMYRPADRRLPQTRVTWAEVKP